MANVDLEIERTVFGLLRCIKQRGYTQQEIGLTLGWGRNFLSELFTRKKELLFEQLLLILEAIGVEPREFFDELYAENLKPRIPVERDFLRDSNDAGHRLFEAPHVEVSQLMKVREMNSCVKALVRALVKKELITTAELAATLDE